MTRSNFGRAFATATAAVTTIALGTTAAGAAQIGPAQFAGAAKAQTLQLTLDAPADLLGLLGSGSSLIDLGISLTEVTSSTSDRLFAATDLLTGTLEGVIPTGGNSDEKGDTFSEQFLGLKQGPLDLGVGTTSFNVDRLSKVVTSHSELAHLIISLDSILGGVAGKDNTLGQVEGAVDQVLGGADALAGDIVGEINAVVNTLEATIKDTSGLDLQIPDVNLTDLNVVRDLRETSLLSIKKLWADTSVTPIGNTVRSVAESGIVGASILGGLVEIPEWTFTAWAETAGTPGSAKWGGNTEALVLNLLGEEIVSLRGSVLTVAGVELDLNDPTFSGILPQEVAGVLDGLVGELLDLTGLSIEQGRVSGEAAPDGSFATASASAFTLSLAPLHAATAIPELAGLVNSIGLGSADELFRLQLDLLPVTATASASPAVAPVPTPPGTTPGQPAPNPAPPSLPRTGGGAAAMAIGTLAMGTAGMLRRKF